MVGPCISLGQQPRGRQSVRCEYRLTVAAWTGGEGQSLGAVATHGPEMCIRVKKTPKHGPDREVRDPEVSEV